MNLKASGERAGAASRPSPVNRIPDSHLRRQTASLLPPPGAPWQSRSTGWQAMSERSCPSLPRQPVLQR
ncbi:MAG: hypothetical protein NTV25_04530 [Methanothrix sp.]|nr:hypothetical protein [Methanothrix sp.]